nr:universal stress protein [Aeromicrobium duanguangcaii]
MARPGPRGLLRVRLQALAPQPGRGGGTLVSIVVGFGSDTRNAAPLELAAELSRTTGDELVLVSVVQDSWGSLRDFAGVDDEWRADVREQAEEAIATARKHLGPDIEPVPVTKTATSVPQALLDECIARRARVLVAGSASHGALGRIAFGSTNDRLAHSSAVPIALAPRGYRSHDDGIQRLVVAVDPTASDVALHQPIADLASWLKVQVEIVTFAVRSGSRTAYSAFADQGVQRAWGTLVRNHQQELANKIRELAPDTEVTTDQVTTAERWSLALESYQWRAGDLLAVGSSRHGPVARVFVGSTATRIVNHSPVPVVLLPRPRTY